MLINSMNYDIEKKEHRLYWILEKVKKLNNHKIEDIDNEINKFQLEISNMNNKIITVNKILEICNGKLLSGDKDIVVNSYYKDSRNINV